jgi:hypothetical protein
VGLTYHLNKRNKKEIQPYLLNSSNIINLSLIKDRCVGGSDDVLSIHAHHPSSNVSGPIQGLD